MEFTRLSSPTLKELFVQELENMILSGKLPIGEKLPPEREIATSMQVSRAVVNDGILELSRKGFLIVKPRVGTFVNDYRTNGTIETLTSILKYNGGIIKNDEIRSIIELKVALNTMAIRLSDGRITDGDIESLRLIVKELSTLDNPTQAAETAFRFHHQMAICSGNTLLPMIVSSFQLPIQILWERYCNSYGVHALYQTIHKLFDYIRDKDYDKAIVWMTKSAYDTIAGDKPIYSA